MRGGLSGRHPNIGYEQTESAKFLFDAPVQLALVIAVLHNWNIMRGLQLG
jgi:hypothetical protein